MNKKETIIYLLTPFFLVVYSSVIYFLISQNNQNLNKKELRRKILVESQNNQDEDDQLVSYFFINYWFLYSLAIIFLQIIANNYVRRTENMYLIHYEQAFRDFFGSFAPQYNPTSDLSYYLTFIKIILNICRCENSHLANVGNYQKKLTFDKQQFLKVFLFDNQSGKGFVRQRAREEFFAYRRQVKMASLKLLAFLMMIFAIIYLVVWQINFFFNVLTCGFQKTLKRLRLSSLWTLIPNMDRISKKIIIYAFFYFPLAIILNYLVVVNRQINQDDAEGFLHFSQMVCLFHRRNFSYQGIDRNNLNFADDKIILSKKGKPIWNLDERYLEKTLGVDADANVMLDFLREEILTNYGKRFIQDMFQYFDQIDVFEGQVKQEIINLIANF